MGADAELFRNGGGMNYIYNIDLLVLLNSVENHSVGEEGLLGAALNAELIWLPFVVKAVDGGANIRNAATFSPDIANEDAVHVVGGDDYDGGTGALAFDLLTAFTTGWIEEADCGMELGFVDGDHSSSRIYSICCFFTISRVPKTSRSFEVPAQKRFM